MNPACARCGKIVYPTEKVSCLDKNWHKGCFHCEVCKMTLNMKNYKGYDKKPYCNAHYPKTSFTTVADTPENLRLRQQSELQSQVKYKKDFEESKGRGFSIVSDTPEMQRLRRTQEQISIGLNLRCPFRVCRCGVGADHLTSVVITSGCWTPIRGHYSPSRASRDSFSLSRSLPGSPSGDPCLCWPVAGEQWAVPTEKHWNWQAFDDPNL
ncbi:LIM zinc-binding domain-containing Nebulette-like [Pungitius pungitius]|uniref:LIM zinc-binding domain-containing Nebulette-like n=1 Tax=Pungitius pungitius TaxID=134920 RepID=UPI002E1245AB